MSKRTVLAFVVVILVTVTIMQNPEAADFTLLFIPMHIPKLVVMTALVIIGFILGLLVSLPRAKPMHHQCMADEDARTHPHSGTLSDEDRDYISEP